MFRHAQEHDVELVPPYTIGFFCGLREAELWHMRISAIRLMKIHVIVPAEFSKTKRKRLVPLSDNAIEWLQWHFTQVRGGTAPRRRTTDEQMDS